MSVSMLLPLLLHNRYLHLGLITPAWVSKFGLTCGTHPVWYFRLIYERVALTSSTKKKLSLSSKVAERSDIDKYSIKNPPKLIFEIAIDH